jgi:hypothetical protein
MIALIGKTLCLWDFMNELKEEIEINSENFSEYFFDVRKVRPKPGQVLAKFSAAAFFGDGQEKRDLIKILRKDKAQAAAMVMRKIHCARSPDCYRVCREMCEDMIAGMSDDEVARKDYEFVLEAFYYTEKGNVPIGDPHWETLDLIKFDPETNTFKAEIHLPSPKKQDSSAK